MFDKVNEAFSRQSEIFDEYEKGNDILKWMRSIVRNHTLNYLRNGDEILELNAGTGLDALFFADKGFKIYCIDIAEGMIKKLAEKVSLNKLDNRINYGLLSFSQLNELKGNKFDYIFSNFGGLNCTDDLKKVFDQFEDLLNPAGRITLVIIPPVCPWEIALLFKGKFRTAFRRLHKNGIDANVEGIKFNTYYHSVRRAKKALGGKFRILEVKGLACVSPPPYMINIPKRYPRIYMILTIIDEKLSGIFPFNRWADHYIITAELIK